MIYHLDFVV